MKHTVIIFDDDAEILQICAIILESKGFHVVTEVNCDNVIEKVMQSGAHVVLMDNSIPKMGGIAATRMLKESDQTKHVPVIFFSANSHVASLCEEAGAEYHLAKPFDISQLESLVSEAVGLKSKLAL
jgi:two-component system, OmpR family, alkaline phosphatase synthesis response regulator PhoP